MLLKCHLFSEVFPNQYFRIATPLPPQRHTLSPFLPYFLHSTNSLKSYIFFTSVSAAPRQSVVHNTLSKQKEKKRLVE